LQISHLHIIISFSYVSGSKKAPTLLDWRLVLSF